MKAIIMYEQGDLPQVADIPEPSVKNAGERLISVKAAAVKHLDKTRATGQHYSARGHGGPYQVIGGDCVGMLADGTRVYAIGESGMLAEKAVVDSSRMVPLPKELDNVTAAALPNAVIGSAMGLRFKAALQKGETVLINGATGFTGKTAVQIARYYGAGKIIATGRNEQSLQQLKSLGADEVISVKEKHETLVRHIKDIHKKTPLDVVIDYLWGPTAEAILSAMQGDGAFTPRTRFVSIGSMAGDILHLSAAQLRSTDIRLYGSGLGSWNKQEVGALFTEILPEMFSLAAGGRLIADTRTIAMEEIDNLWAMDGLDGKRVVVTLG